MSANDDDDDEFHSKPSWDDGVFKILFKESFLKKILTSWPRLVS